MNKLRVTMAAQLLAEAYKKVAKELLRAMPAGCTRVKEVRHYSEAPSSLDEMRSCIQGTGGIESWTDPIAPTNKRFYKVTVYPPE